jgi:hypothetical protein
VARFQGSFSSDFRDSGGFVHRKEKGHSTLKCRTSNSPATYVSNEDQIPLLDWTVDGLPPMDVGA